MLTSKYTLPPAFEMDHDCDSDARHLLTSEKLQRPDRRQNKWNKGLLIVNGFVFVLNIAFLVFVGVPGMVHNGPGSVPSLPHQDWINPAIELELRSYDDKFATHGVFRGQPRKELDEAWGDIVRNYTVRVPLPGWQKASAPQHILTEFQDERGGIMATFSFLHNIHCLKTIRQLLAGPEYYPETAEEYKTEPGVAIPEHIDHCFDILRQSELCHADMTLNVFEWHKDERRPINLHHSQHVCKNKEKLTKFLEENTVPPFGGILVHPWTGQSPY